MTDRTDSPSHCCGDAANPVVTASDLGENSPLPAVESLQIVTVEIGQLVLEGSPRSAGEDPDHTRSLADVTDVLPPIIVHRSTMQVIDGMHRVRAALRNGRSVIDARIVDCDERTAFVLAVKSNITHGLPLSPADRKAAAVSIFASHPEWSDRAVAMAVGVSDKTVSALRGSSTAEHAQSNSRVGRDGRVRPLNSAARRRQAAEMLTERPDAALREVARATGLSPATVRDVRHRTDRGEDPVPERYRAAEDPDSLQARRARSKPGGMAKQLDVPIDRQMLLTKLMNDPSVRFSESGKYTLRWLYQYTVDPQSCQSLGQNVPHHWAELVADLARNCATAWTMLADQLEERTVEGNVSELNSSAQSR
ncbi:MULTISPECIES: ParB N-terminal domain-containing protein [unclassified Streptomyces]|uniref:ParB N-terminal domain-containing protein n=1 Tax=unclassified Streptomyces TaxID=2593676 RepID=UPI002DD9E664|nr:ParB N-terminal domain-containing protein [Streptomyces sp. NBC_00243]WRZ17315.1 ParB N-terminal domain-containing protein [Streptomyces sp. NBC_00243]